MPKPNQLPVQRLNGPAPILSPQGNTWESGGTINASAIYLPRSPANDPLIRGLLGRAEIDDQPGGVVAVHYRAFPASGADVLIAASSLGLAVFTPEMQLLKRFPEPILVPGVDLDSFDHLGIEDPRITRIGATFFLLYCGPRLDSHRPYRTRLCLATSTDLLHWKKHGPIVGGPDLWDNKDGVLFPQPIQGKYYLLHRPWGQEFAVSDYNIWLASADTPYGPWQEHGSILHAYQNPAWQNAWLGGGSVPIPLGDQRYLVIYHTAAFITPQHREYDMGAAIFDFKLFSPANPSRVVVSRLEPFLRPETDYECGQTPDGGKLDVVFPCGSYEYRGEITIIYGAGDLHTAALRVNRQELLDALAQSGLQNPYSA